MKSFLLRWMITALSVLIAAQVLDGITYTSLGALLFAALMLGILNAVIRPILLLLSLPFIVLTLGIFILAVNAALLKLASGLTPGFHVTGFWTAIFGALIISAVSWTLSVLFRDEDRKLKIVRPSAGMKLARGRVIQ